MNGKLRVAALCIFALMVILTLAVTTTPAFAQGKPDERACEKDGVVGPANGDEEGRGCPDSNPNEKGCLNGEPDCQETPEPTSTPVPTSTPEPQKHNPVEVCHKPGTPAQQTLTIDDSALPGHLGHGDTQGKCPVMTPPVTITPTVTPTPTETPTEEPTKTPTENPIETEVPTEEPKQLGQVGKVSAEGCNTQEMIVYYEDGKIKIHLIKDNLFVGYREVVNTTGYLESYNSQVAIDRNCHGYVALRVGDELDLYRVNLETGTWSLYTYTLNASEMNPVVDSESKYLAYQVYQDKKWKIVEVNLKTGDRTETENAFMPDYDNEGHIQFVSVSSPAVYGYLVSVPVSEVGSSVVQVVPLKTVEMQGQPAFQTSFGLKTPNETKSYIKAVESKPGTDNTFATLNDEGTMVLFDLIGQDYLNNVQVWDFTSTGDVVQYITWFVPSAP